MTQNSTKTAKNARWLLHYFKNGNSTNGAACLEFSNALDGEYHPRTLEHIAKDKQKPSVKLARKINALHNRHHKRKPPSGGSVWLSGTPEELRAIREGLGARERAEILLERIRDG